MPVQECESEKKPGYRWGSSGTCYTYDGNDEDARKRAKQKAAIQGYAIEMSQKRAHEPSH